MLQLNNVSVYAEVLSKMHEACFDQGWSVSDFKGLLDLKTTVLFVSETSFLLCSHVLNEMEILTLGVLPSFRHQGQASHLLNEMVEYARDQQVERIFLEVSVQNSAAQNLYLKKGFQVVGRRRNYYHVQNKLVDALCLVRTLD